MDSQVDVEVRERPSADPDAQNRQRRGTRQLLIARMGMMASGYLVAMILARGLGPAEYGLYGFIVSAVVWLQMAVTAGIPGASSKLIPERLARAGDVESSARFLLLATSVVCFAAGWLLAPSFARAFDIPDPFLFRLAIFEIPFAAMYAGYQGILSGHRRFGALAVASVLYAGAKLVGIGILLAAGVSLAGALLVNVLSTAAVFLWLFARYPAFDWRPRRGMLRPLLAIAVPMGVYLVTQQVLLSVDLWSLKGLWRGEAEVVGYYVASLTLARTLLIVPGVQSGVVFTLTAWALARDDEEAAAGHLSEATRFAVLVIAPAAVFLGLHAGPVMSLLFSTPYAAGASFLVLHLIGFGLFALLDTFLHGMMAAGRQRLSASILVGLVPVVLVANAVLIPRIGPRGAAVSLVLGVAIATVIAGILAYRRFGRAIPLATVARTTIAIAVVAVPAAWIPAPGAWVLVKLVGMELACLGVLAVLREVTAADFMLPSVGAAIEPAP